MRVLRRHILALWRLKIIGQASYGENAMKTLMAIALAIVLALTPIGE